MNVKQFKRRLVNGLVEPELFYMPVGKKDIPKGNLTIRLFTYTTYNLDTKQYEKNKVATTGKIVVMDSMNNIIYNSKSDVRDSSFFYLYDISYGTYKIKIIKSNTGLVDNTWHTVIVNKKTQICDITLPWVDIYKVDTYLKNENIPTYIYNEPNGSRINNVEAKGVLYDDYYEGDNLILTRRIINAYGGLDTEYISSDYYRKNTTSTVLFLYPITQYSTYNMNYEIIAVHNSSSPVKNVSLANIQASLFPSLTIENEMSHELQTVVPTKVLTINDNSYKYSGKRIYSNPSEYIFNLSEDSNETQINIATRFKYSCSYYSVPNANQEAKFENGIGCIGISKPISINESFLRVYNEYCTLIEKYLQNDGFIDNYFVIIITGKQKEDSINYYAGHNLIKTIFTVYDYNRFISEVEEGKYDNYTDLKTEILNYRKFPLEIGNTKLYNNCKKRNCTYNTIKRDVIIDGRKYEHTEKVVIQNNVFPPSYTTYEFIVYPTYSDDYDQY